MHTYPRNSPQAAARLVALALIADGHVCQSELDALRLADTESRLGLHPGEFAGVLQTLCEDLLHVGQPYGSLASCLDGSLIESLIREVDDAELQRHVMASIVAAAAADGHLSEGEQYVMDVLRDGWKQRRHAVPEPVPA